MNDIDQLCEIEKLRALNSRRLLADVQSREADLRQQIDSVKAFRTDLHSPDPSLTPMRAIGSDVLWAKWLDRTQSRLNTSLARVLSEKEMVLRKARKDIGRSESVSALRDNLSIDAKNELRKRDTERIIALSVLSRISAS